MTQREIREFLAERESQKDRTIVIVDFSNVEKWKDSLGWSVGIRELGNLVKCFSGTKALRRFYYGSDYGRFESSTTLRAWSRSMLEKAKMNGFSIVTKRVKYMHSESAQGGFETKCDLDVEMAVDLIWERDNYDTMVVFSGDGDLSYAIKYLASEFDKKCIVFGARDRIGRELIDAKDEGHIQSLLYAEDFEYRLSMARRNRGR